MQKLTITLPTTAPQELQQQIITALATSINWYSSQQDYSKDNAEALQTISSLIIAVSVGNSK